MAEDKKDKKKEEEKKDVAEATAAEGGEGSEGEAAPKKSKKKLILLIVLAVLLIGGGAAGILLSGILKGEEHKEADAALEQKTVYFDLDEFLINLNNPGNQVSFLKTVITLEIPNQVVLTEVQDKMPRIRDAFQTYLRELRNSDLQGSAGLQRLRAELLLRVNSMLEKGKVTSVLFKEIIVQ